jgi:branched-chain amino acid transport system permease protein
LLQYVIAGLVIGGIYALASAGLVVTFVSSGVLNFAFGALAFTVARTFYFVHMQHGWALLPSVLFCMFFVGPALGAVLYALIFRHLVLASQLIKVVITIGVSTLLQPVATASFGDVQIVQAPGISPQPVRIFHVAGLAVSMDQALVALAVGTILTIGFLVLRLTDAGLSVRAMVDSPAMTALSGSNPSAISLTVWMVSSFLAGVCGMLLAPVIGLSTIAFTQLIAAAFAAVVAARLRNLGVAIAVSFVMGVTGSVLQYFLPPASTLTNAVLPSVPFAFIVVFLVIDTVHAARVGRSLEIAVVGGAIDRAIAPSGGARLAAAAETVAEHRSWANQRAPLVGFGLLLVLPVVLHPFWVILLTQAMALSLLLLSYTLVTGEGGMLWLSQITFAGVGSLLTAQLATVHGWPVLAAVIVAALVAAAMGMVLGLATLRLGDLHTALVTLTAGLIMEGLVFPRPMFLQQGVGVALERPDFARGDVAFAYLTLGAIAVVCLLIMNVRRSTTGLALNAVRWSDTGARTLGISVVQMKLFVAGISAFVAGIGGAFISLQTRVSFSQNFSVYLGLVLLTYVVTLGLRSNAAAVLAGMAFVMLPEALRSYFPPRLLILTPVLFGVGAIQLAKHPNGVAGALWRRMLAMTHG